MMTDPIADMLTRIRNGNSIYRAQVDVPYSRIKESIARKMKQEGYIKDYKVEEKTPGKNIIVYLKYGPDGEKIIREIRRVSKSGQRVYTKVPHQKVLKGLGIAIISTSKGILTDAECRFQKVGGEILCNIW